MEARESSRHEIAERLRKMAKKHAAVEASRVARAIGLEYKVYGTVVAFTSADVQDLADLIDPTCRNGYSSLNDRSFLCSKCGYEAFTYDDSNCDPDEFEFCPHCGRRLVTRYEHE